MKQRATVFLRGKQFFIHSTSVTTAGVGLATEPFVALTTDSDGEAIGIAALEALNSSHEGIPHPTNWKGILDPLLRMSSCKSWSAFASKAVCYELLRDDGLLTIIPTRRRTDEGSFEHLVSESELLKNPSANVLGTKLLGCFNRPKGGSQI